MEEKNGAQSRTNPKKSPSRDLSEQKKIVLKEEEVPLPPLAQSTPAPSQSTPSSVRFDEHVWEYLRIISEETHERVQELFRESVEIGMLFLPLKGRVDVRGERIGNLSRSVWIRQMEPWILLALHTLNKEGVDLIKLPEEQLIKLSVLIATTLVGKGIQMMPGDGRFQANSSTGPLNEQFSSQDFTTDDTMNNLIGSGGFGEIGQDEEDHAAGEEGMTY